VARPQPKTKKRDSTAVEDVVGPLPPKRKKKKTNRVFTPSPVRVSVQK
jgi:hypothetical protein